MPEEAEAWASAVVERFARQPEAPTSPRSWVWRPASATSGVANSSYRGIMTESDDGAQREAAGAVGLLFPDQDDMRSASSPTPATSSRSCPASPSRGPLAPYAGVKAGDLRPEAPGRNNPAAIRIFDRVGWQ